jgi:H(+)-translocating pyrophosphatase
LNGADLVGKVEEDIPEDDLRNPAVIADLVGDNVGDCAGRGADLFESIAAENIGAMILAGTLAAQAAPQISIPYSYIIFPLMIHVFGMFATWIGIFFVRVKDKKSYAESADSDESTAQKQPLLSEGAPDAPSDQPYQQPEQTISESQPSISDEKKTADDLDDPMHALNRGLVVSTIIALGLFVLACFWLLNVPEFPAAWWHFALCGLYGIITSIGFVVITIYYTDYNWAPVQMIIKSSGTGAATNIISGIAVGMESTALPVVMISAVIIASYYTGRASGIVDINGVPIGGLFGTAVATMGMLSSATYILAMDVFGPITDNAGGIVEMSQLPHHVRQITDRLDAVGNTTKALTKGYAIGSAALASFLLFSAFMDTISAYSNTPFTVVNLAVPETFVGALIGAMLVFLFSSLAIRAVGNTAETVIQEVRRQFRERPGIRTFEEKPDYSKCVAIVTRSALVQMILPGALATLVPITLGFVFRFIGYLQSDRFMGPQVVAGFLMVATITGILVAMFLNNGGGAWDNAKKYLESVGKKGTDAHKAAVIGDTVGDPFKDTAGPALHVLIKLLSTIVLVLGPLFLNAQ